MRAGGLTAVSLMLLVGAALPATAQSRQRWNDEQRAIAEVIERTAAANNAGDVEAWATITIEAEEIQVFGPWALPAVA